MDLNRLKKNIINRDWSNKTKQSNINYIIGKVKQFGLAVPKYLNKGKLTDKQIQANTNKIQREIEKQLDIKRVQANIPTMEKAMNQLEKAVVKHNQLVYKKLNYGRKATLEKCKEELEELIQALNKNDFENVHEEVADVYNILSHIKAYYNITDNEIKERQQYKVKRQLKRMKQER